MAYVQRDGEGKIQVWALLPSSDANEQIADDDPELVEFMNRTNPALPWPPPPVEA